MEGEGHFINFLLTHERSGACGGRTSKRLSVQTVLISPGNHGKHESEARAPLGGAAVWGVQLLTQRSGSAGAFL